MSRPERVGEQRNRAVHGFRAHCTVSSTGSSEGVTKSTVLIFKLERRRARETMPGVDSPHATRMPCRKYEMLGACVSGDASSSGDPFRPRELPSARHTKRRDTSSVA